MTALVDLDSPAIRIFRYRPACPGPHLVAGQDEVHSAQISSQMALPVAVVLILQVEADQAMKRRRLLEVAAEQGQEMRSPP